MSTNINNIFQLPELYQRKATLEREIRSLQADIKEKSETAKRLKDSAVNKVNSMKQTVENYRKSCRRYWNAYAEQNSATRLQKKIDLVNSDIKSLNDNIRNRTQWRQDAEKLINSLNTDLREWREAKEEWTEAATKAAQTAMLSGVCIYLNRQDWRLAYFNDKTDWGVHCSPDPVNVPNEVSGTWEMLNFLNYSDIKQVADKARKAYKRYYTIDHSLNNIRSRHRLTAGREIAGLQESIATYREQSQECQKHLNESQQELSSLTIMMRLMKDGTEAFLRKDFTRESALSPISTHIRNLKEAMRNNSDYSEMRSVYDDLCEHATDYKQLDGYVQTAVQRLQNEVENAPGDLLRKCDYSRSLLQKDTNELNDVMRRIHDTRAAYDGSLLAQTQEDPITTFFYTGANWLNEGGDRNNAAVKVIDRNAKTRYALSALPTYKYIDLEGRKEPFLSTIPWQTGDTNAVNLLVRPLREHSKMHDANIWAASNLITAILLSMPIRKVHFTFIDFATNGVYSKLLSRLNNKHKNLYTLINEDSQLTSLKRQYNEHTQEVGTDNLVQFHLREQEIRYPYEIVVWVDCYGPHASAVKNNLNGIMQNGARYGYYMIAVPLDDQMPADQHQIDVTDKILDEYDFQEVICDGSDFDNGRSAFIKALTDYVERGADTSVASSIPQPSMRDGSIFREQPIDVPDDGIKVPIGINSKGIEEHYVFNVKSDYPHTFLIGGSGSGKSYLIQNVLLNAMLKYKAGDLEFYLMDFKMGGGEFRFYEGMPHVSHLLVDDADHQAVYEILSELKRKMEERGRKIAENKDLPTYNALHPNDKLPYIILVVDECHKLFEVETADSKMQDEINKVITYIVKEGRSQGVTFFFATQTFVGMHIPRAIQNEARNKYLMRVTMDEDAKDLIEDGAQRNSQLSQGFAYHNATREFIHIYDYKPYAQQAKEAIMAHNQRPVGRNNFVFSGKDMYRLADATPVSKPFPVAFIGKSVSVTRHDVTIELRKEEGENILITGINEHLQAERVFWSAALSLAQQQLTNHRVTHIILIDNFGDEDENYEARYPSLQMLRHITQSDIQIVSGRKREEAIARIGQIVRQENPEEENYLLFILGQERMKRLLDKPLPSLATTPAPQEGSTSAPAMGFNQFGLPDMSQFIKNRPAQSAYVTTSLAAAGNVKEELENIMRNGPEFHVHVVMQVNQPSNMFDYVSRTDLSEFFNHVVVLNCARDEENKLPLDGVRIDRLNTSEEMLRAYYYNGRNNQHQMLTPYVLIQ